MVRNHYLVIGFVWLGLAAVGWTQGSLTPPGAPAPTMKTLNQIEPRIPISTAGYSISNSGSYYLTTNLTTTSHGIQIYANDVDLDLMGFTISGNTVPGYQGVHLVGKTNEPIVGVTIHNGIIRNFGTGIRASYSWNSLFENLILTGHYSQGIHFYGQNTGVGCIGNKVIDCTIMNCTNYGIDVNARSLGECSANLFQGCVISQCGSAGIFFDALTGGLCSDSRVIDCVISSNHWYGVHFENSVNGICRDIVIEDCVLHANGLSGIYAYSYSTGRCDGVSISDCAISENGSSGINLSGEGGVRDTHHNIQIRQCLFYQNTAYGIYLAANFNGRIDGNHMTMQANSGIYANTSYSNLVFRNSGSGNSVTNFRLHASNTYGPYVSDRGALSTISGTNSLSPWANFSR